MKYSVGVCLLASAMNRFSSPSVSRGEGQKHFLFLYNFLFSDIFIQFYNFLYVAGYLLAILKGTLLFCACKFLLFFLLFSYLDEDKNQVL